ncbi:MAG: hypothetical protein IT206_05010 [Fimbriimonadaceae bacterium]|nr:hypothetical protein [Fimbriimonadaceae bacterium]
MLSPSGSGPGPCRKKPSNRAVDVDPVRNKLMQTHQLFPIGRLLATPAVLAEVEVSDIREALGRHTSGDWGELEQEDKNENDLALKIGERILSAYKASTGVKFWIITERDRSATTILLPSDY